MGATKRLQMKKNRKMRIPFYKYINGLMLLLCIIALAACSGDDEDMDSIAGEAIGFECQTGTLRNTSATTGDMQYFRVSAIWDKDGGGYQSFMNNQLVERNGSDWVYSPVRYWPVYGQVSFFAYSPAISSGLSSFDINNTDNKITIGYKVPGEGELQEDFLVATALERTNSPVHLQFEHALASAGFWAKTSDTGTSYRINKITLKNLNSTGTLTGMAVNTITSWAWGGISAPADYEVYLKYAFDVPAAYDQAGSMMVLPQVTGNDFEIIVTYNDTKTARYTLDSGFEFEMGKKYSFYLEIGGTSFEGAQGRNNDYPVSIKYSIDEHIY